jgi:PKD repeat protein
MKRHLIFAVCFLVISLIGISQTRSNMDLPETNKHSPQTINLFENSATLRNDPEKSLHFFDQKEAVNRFGEVSLNSDLINISLVQIGDEIALNLFENSEYTATVSYVGRNVNGTAIISAKINGYDFAFMVITTTGERSLANVFIPEKKLIYQISSDPVTLDHFLIELDNDKLDYLVSSPPLIPNILNKDDLMDWRPGESDKTASGPNDPANIDVMIVYTPAAQNWANNHGGGIENVIAQAMVKGEQALANSATIMTITLVHSALISYTESGNSSTDLNNFTFMNGSMDEVHSWRNQYGADLCAIFAYVEDTGGLAWLLNNKNGAPTHGFSLTRVQQAGWTYTHIHEMGHNMGCHHHKEQNFQPGPTNWWNWTQNIWSAGWRWTGTDNGKYCSIMTYEDGSYFPDGVTHTRVPHFSNPNVNHAGVATGHAVDGDNARTLREIKHTVAAYRASVSAPEISVTPLALTETHANPGTITTQTLLITNNGDLPLQIDISIQSSSLIMNNILENTAGKTVEMKKSGQHKFIVNPDNSGNQTPSTRSDAVIRWDNGINFQGLGLEGGGAYQVGAYFPASTMEQYMGMKLSQVEVFINAMPTLLTLNIYGQGSASSPGQLLHSQAVTNTLNDWSMIDLTGEVPITGEDFWITFSLVQQPMQFAMGTDAGPAVAGYGDLISIDGFSWDALSVFGLDFNWNIAGHLDIAWLSASPLSGTVNPGQTIPVTVTFNSEGLPEGIYNGQLVVNSNDPDNPSITVPATLIVETTEPLSADFVAEPLSGEAPLTVAFTDLSTGNIQSWEWDFDNNGNVDSYEQHPEWVYNEQGSYSVKLTIYDNTDASSSMLMENYINVTAPTFEHNVELNDGWTGISSFLLPQNIELISLMDQLSNLVIIQNPEGFYQPQNPENTISLWDHKSGYFIKTAGAGQLNIVGTIPSDKTISLVAGWNLIPVLSDEAVSINALFAGHTKKIVIIKDATGFGMNWPEHDITTLQYLSPGKAYLVKMTQPATISF